MSQTSTVRKVDQTGLKVGQAATIILLISAFIVSSWIFVAIVAVSQLLGAIDVSFAPFRLLYRSVLLSLGVVKPHVETDNPEPHRFAMLVGALFNTAAVLFLLAGLPVVGWVLVWIVIILANLNFWLNICLGCMMYYQFNRFGVPGFTAAKLPK